MVRSTCFDSHCKDRAWLRRKVPDEPTPSVFGVEPEIKAAGLSLFHVSSSQILAQACHRADPGIARGPGARPATTSLGKPASSQPGFISLRLPSLHLPRPPAAGSLPAVQAWAGCRRPAAAPRGTAPELPQGPRRAAGPRAAPGCVHVASGFFMFLPPEFPSISGCVSSWTDPRQPPRAAT